MNVKNKFSRREFLISGAASFLLAGKSISQTNKKSKKMLVYIGTYTTNTGSEGIYVCDFDAGSGELTARHTIKNVAEPSFLTIDKNGKNLYAVNELVEYEGKKSGAVSAFAIDQKTGNLTFLNRQPSLGGAPCYITASDNGKFVLVANYVGGNVSVFPVEKNGRLGASVELVQHAGTGPNTERQEAAHAHSIILDRNNRFAFAADLGTDKLMIYEFDAQKGKLKPNAAHPFFKTKPGAGPRHFVFHKSGKHAFLINELDSSLTSLAYDEKRGTLKEIQTLSTLPKDFSGENTCADVHVSPDGRFVYGSNRGHDSIAVFKTDEKTGKIELIEIVSTGGKTPRNFAIDPGGNFLLAANQNSGNIVTFRIDQKTGKLKNTGNEAKVPAPVCLKFIPAFS